MKTRPTDRKASFEMKGIGRVGLQHSHRCRHMNLTVKPFRGVRVTAPYGVTREQVEQFVVSKADWIVKHLAQARHFERLRRHAAGRMEKIDDGEAGEQLARKLKELAARHGFTVGKVSVRRQKTLWGSCSADNNISLNINLIHLPRQLMTYVILHELLHTRIKNHSQQFWNELDTLVGDARLLRAWLNEYGYLLLDI